MAVAKLLSARYGNNTPGTSPGYFAIANTKNGSINGIVTAANKKNGFLVKDDEDFRESIFSKVNQAK
jgi:hypothetical protein